MRAPARGLKGYVTNIPADLMPAGEVIARYHDLWQVEASFRISKTDRRARPILHHTREASEAHLTTVFAALVFGRYVQDETGMSSTRPSSRYARSRYTSPATNTSPKTPGPTARSPSRPSTSPFTDVPRWHESGPTPERQFGHP